MSIYKGNKKVVGLYKGSTPIIRRYKGTNLIFDATSNDDNYDIILELKDFGYGYGTFKLNDIDITPTSSTYKANLSDLGISELTSFNFSNSNITDIIKMPNTSKVTSLNSKFSYSSINSIDTSDWDLSSLTDAAYAYSFLSNATSIDINENDYLHLENLSGFYGGCSKITNANLPTSTHTKNTSYAFYGCSGLTEARFNVIDNVTDISHMFDGCRSLTSIYGNFWPNEVTNTSYLFRNCSSLDMGAILSSNISSNISNLLMANKCTNISYMFTNTNWGDNYQFTFPDNWYISNILDASHLFNGANISSFDFNSTMTKIDRWMWRCQNYDYMFANNNNLSSISFYNLDFNGAQTMVSMFENCSNLQTVDFGGVSNFSPSDVSYMFKNCSNLQRVYCSDCDVYDILKQALETSGLDYLNILENTNGECGKVYDPNKLEFSFNPTDVSSVNLTLNNTVHTIIPEYCTQNDDGTVTYSADIVDLIGSVDILTSTHNCFYIFSGAPVTNTILSVTNFPDTSNVTDMSNMFYCNRGLTELDISHLDTRQVTNMASMFYRCSGLTELDVTHFVTTNVEDMSSMFDNCRSLTTINVGNFDVSNVKNMRAMFSDSVNLTSIVGLDNFNTVNVTNMMLMFYGLSGITSLNLSNWFVNGVTNFNLMFNGCTNLTTLDLSGWNVNTAIAATNMFRGCTSLQTIYVRNCTSETIDWLIEHIDRSGLDSSSIQFIS